MSSKLAIDVAPAFRPLLTPSRYKGTWGGRGSGKSHFLAGLMVASAFSKQGFRGLCVREVQKSLRESAKRLLEDKIEAFGLGPHFEIQRDQIKTPGNGLIVFAGMQDHTVESIKSFEGFNIAWAEEAQTLSPRSLELLRPTIRAPGSELWFSWNPRKKDDPVDEMLRGEELPTGAIVAPANWSDNPWFPAELEQERLDCKRLNPEQYGHIWEGEYVTISKGAYFAAQLVEAKAKGRIGHVSPDPLLRLRAYCDIGGPGAKADAFALWVCQFVGREIRVLNFYEAQGQELSAHLHWLRSQGYKEGSISIFLPHDGSANKGPYSQTWESAFRDAGYDTETIVGSGSGHTGAAAARIEAARRVFPSIWFDEETTEGGRAALGWYHERRDDKRSIGLGPEHDWSSHAADAFGLMCVAYEAPQEARKPKRQRVTEGGWMG